jgi:catechol 2,3-dioxygenase-like lactoylglutathione lyase family enzyme
MPNAQTASQSAAALPDRGHGPSANRPAASCDSLLCDMRRTVSRVSVLLAFLLMTGIPAHAQLDTPSPPLGGIAHVAVRVHDLAASVAFYEKLGFQKAFDLTEHDVPSEAVVKIAVIKINDQQFLELYPVSDKAPAAGFLHVCFEGADLEAIREDYESRGLTPAAAHKSAAGDLLFTVAGPVQPFGAQTIEFTQYLPDSLHSNDLGQHLGPDRVADKLIAVSLAVDDPDSARDFYINELNFKPVSGDPMDLHMPGNSGQEIEIVPASLGTQAHITLNTENLGKAARHLHKEGVPVEKNGASITITDPDGNIILLESR